MSTAGKRKGTTWERAVAEYLRERVGYFASAERAPRWGSVDKGDLVGTGPFTIECKATKTLALAQFVDEAEVESQNAGTEYGVAVVKRRQKGVDQGYVVMTLETFATLAHDYCELRYGR